MEDARDDTGPAEQGSPIAPWWPSDFVEKFGSVSLASQEETLKNDESTSNYGKDGLSSQRASEILWNTGMLSEPIPNGFYSVILEKRLKDYLSSLPTLDELAALGSEGFKADIILVDAEKDKKLSMLKKLIKTLAKGPNLSPAAIIKKIAVLVADFYMRPNLDSPVKANLDEASHVSESLGVRLLGKIKQGTSRPRAILFKALADTIGLECRLMMGLPSDGANECVDSYKHMAIFTTHIPAAGESDSAENDSCDSPLEPNSPLYGFSDRLDPDCTEKDESLQFQQKLEASSNTLGPSLRNIMLRSNSIDRKLSSLSHSEPNIANAFWRRGRNKKGIVELRTASSSPEHPSSRAHRRSMLSSDGKSFRDFANESAPSSYRSDGASTSDARRLKRRSISITPEIGDDIVRAVRAMNETLKQNRALREQGDDRSFPYGSNERKSSSGIRENVSDYNRDDHGEIPLRRLPMGSQKAISLPSSPQTFRSQVSDRTELPEYGENNESVMTWCKVLESAMFNNKPLLPFQEWNIDFAELTVGTRVGIGFFGEVFRGTWNGTDVAIKVFLEQDLTAENMEDFCNEISILSRLRHPNVILFLGACTKPPRLSMVTEHMELGSLYFLIHLSGQKKKLSWRRKLKMLRDICRGLMCIHRMKIVHRDLKSANCLVNKHSVVKICDFGLSRIMTESPMKDSCSAGTPEWMAPELIRNEPFTEKCDIFSLGVIMWELCTLSRPWEGVPPERVVYAVANEGSRLDIPDGPLGRLISDCWAEPPLRPSCEEILLRLPDCEYALY